MAAAPDATARISGVQPPRKAVLSLVLGSRNDSYMGNSRWRLQTALNYVAKQAQDLGRDKDVEVIVTDWGSKIPLPEALRLSPAAAGMVSFLAVPPDLARELQRDSPFPEVLAVNAAARRAGGDYIGRIDQDTLVGGRFLRTFFDLHEGRRRLDVPLAEALLFANQRMVPYRVAARCPPFWAIERFVDRFGPRLNIEVSPRRRFYAHGVGIWLVHRNLWQACGGYDERMIYANEQEINMIARLIRQYAMVDLGKLVDYDFYHIEHYHPLERRSSRRYRKVNPSLPFSRPERMNPNGEDWGLHRHSLQVLPYDGKVDTAACLEPPSGAARYLLLVSLAGIQMALDSLLRPPLRASRALGTRMSRWARKAGALARTGMRAALQATGLLGPVRRCRRRLGEARKFARDPEFRRRKRADLERYERFKAHYGHVLEASLAPASGAGKTVLFVSRIFRHMELQLVLLHALALAGYRPVVLVVSPPGPLQDCYRWAGVETVCDWSRYVDGLDFSAAAATSVARCASIDDLLGFEHAGSRCGKNAVSTALRGLRTGTLDLQSPEARQFLVGRLAASMASATAASALLRQLRPDLMVCFDAEYTPGVELFDLCMERGIEVVTHREGHKNDTLILKRYSRPIRDQNPVSLSDDSWAAVTAMPWGDAHRNALRKEFHDDYASGNWYGVAGTQFNTRIEGAEALRGRLGLSPGRKTAFIFPHIPWDAAFRWGRDLFGSYEEWLVATVRAACLNDRVNWVIKIHPANVGKLLKGKYQEPAETVALRERLGTLPPHVRLIPPDSDISTYSLFPLMDYCLTVRGTIGIEAATLGIPVITAGTGRYEGKGFTIDPASREEYLDRIARIQDIAPLSAAERERAERFAYGLFLLRPFPVRSISLEFSDHSGAEAGFTRARINIAAKDGWRQASDLQAFGQWLNASRNPDFLVQA